MSTLQELIGDGAVVYSDEDLGILVTFRGGQTFNVWCADLAGDWENTSLFMVDGYQNASVRDLRALCVNHFAEELAYADDDR